MTCSKIEVYITDFFLKFRGSWPVYELAETPQTQVDLAEVEKAINETTDAMRASEADIDSLAVRLRALNHTRKEINSRPNVVAQVRRTGKTYQQAWDASKSVQERRAILSRAFTSVRLKKGVKGRTGPFDPERVVLWGYEPTTFLNANNVERTMRYPPVTTRVSDIDLIVNGKRLD